MVWVALSDFWQPYLSGWNGQALLATAICLLLSLFVQAKKKCSTRHDIPLATGSVPLLGHALAYKAGPADFLQRQEATVGHVFRINLAGRHMVIVGSDARAMKQVATLPESVLSASVAVAEIGFEYTLGRLNVYAGTDWHKRILKNRIYANNTTTDPILSALLRGLDEAAAKEIRPSEDTDVVMNDLFAFVRRLVLRTVLDYLVGTTILEDDSNSVLLLDDFMDFQDALEDATAKAAVLPRFLATPMVLRPVEQQRARLVKKLAPLVAAAWKNDQQVPLGPWLAEFQQQNISSTEAAELLIGLVFAAHKNPAIGAAQAFCFLETEPSSEQQQVARQEARDVWSNFCETGVVTRSMLLQATTLRCCVLETMRLTAHSIGTLRKAQESFVLETESGRTYTIKQGDTIAIAHITTHRDSHVWGDHAETFDLTRWNQESSNKNNSLTSPVSDYKLTTFSNGLHKCPGEQLAMAMMQLLLVVMYSRDSKCTTNDGNKEFPELDFERATLAQRSGPIPFTIADRAKVQ